MSDITYCVVEERYAMGSKSRLSYGVAAFDSAEKDGLSTIVASIHDITNNKAGLAELVKQCNLLELSPIHLYEVIEDFLSV